MNDILASMTKMIDNSDTKNFNEYSAKLKALSKDVSKELVFDITFWFAINENEWIQRLVYYVYYSSLIDSGFGLLFILFGLLSLFYALYYMSIFAFICVLQVLVAPMAHLAFKNGKRLDFLLLVFVNLLWLGFALIFCAYYIFKTKDTNFNENVMFHFAFLVYFIISVSIQVVCLILIIKLVNIFIQQLKVKDAN